MKSDRKAGELETLKIIAETINRSRDTDHMLNSVLEKLLEATGLQTGWIFLMEKDDARCAADCNLPPALSREDKRPMKTGACWCMDRYRSNRLNQAINILNCKRLEDAKYYNWGDTENITHHATIPLWSGSRRIGIMNVAAPQKVHFSDDELALLQSVALQIGTALERIKLFEKEQKRANRYSRLGEISKRLGSVLESGQIPAQAARWAAELMESPFTALFMREEDKLAVRTLYSREALSCPIDAFSMEEAGISGEAFQSGNPVLAHSGEGAKLFPLMIEENAGIQSALAVPMIFRGQPYGVLFAGSMQKNGFDSLDVEVMEAYAEHVSLSFENARLFEERRTLARWEERNRLARDLHDSVSQMLFSLNMTARALQNVATGLPPIADEALRDIQQLSQNALGEMRALIHQLRPAGLEEGLLTGLQKYANGLGLEVSADMQGVVELGRGVEEALFRIGQEALNNIRKHAGVNRAEICLACSRSEVTMAISDNGKGISANAKASSRVRKASGFGLNIMRERAEQIGGTLNIQSRKGKGTHLEVRIPVHSMKTDGGGTD